MVLSFCSEQLESGEDSSLGRVECEDRCDSRAESRTIDVTFRSGKFENHEVGDVSYYRFCVVSLPRSTEVKLLRHTLEFILISHKSRRSRFRSTHLRVTTALLR